MLVKLPLDNTTLKAISFLNPDKRGKPGSLSQLTEAANLFQHILSDEEKLSIDEEIRSFVVKDSLSSLGSTHVELWWTKAASLPTLQKLVKAALSLFHGPQVRASFSLIEVALFVPKENPTFSQNLVEAL